MSEPYDWTSPGHADTRTRPHDREACCPNCGMLVRRADTGHACDRCGPVTPVWHDVAEEGPEPDEYRYAGGGRWTPTSR